MFRNLSSVAAFAVAVLAAMGAFLAGCSAKHQPAPAVSASTAKSSGMATVSGAGTANIEVGSLAKRFDVTCIRGGSATQATGNEGSDALTLTVVGTPIAVFVSHGADGSTTIYQAIPGLHDDSGKASAAVSVTANGDSYQGTATFVLTRIDPKGSRVPSATASDTSHGTFELDCSHGYASPPRATVPSKTPAGSAAPSVTPSS